jgi:hypothetical protein
VIQKLAFALVNRCRTRAGVEHVLSASLVNQFHCGQPRIVYFLNARSAHDLETSAVLETGRTCKSAAVCALATLSKRLSDRNP